MVSLESLTAPHITAALAIRALATFFISYSAGSTVPWWYWRKGGA